ncbi:MAG: enoyl-[acyl-carrier-protein] reductase FabK [Bacillota bacterium]|nr:enoyl-[acyl-carrier-protein] reductase FabK [Bacillota bacterium]
MIKSVFADMLHLKYPVIQGGMAWIADSKLAAAVSNAGGLGLIAGGNAPTEWVRDEIRKAKTLTDKPFGVNIMLLSPYADEIAHMVAEEKVAVLTTGAGNPGKYLSMWKDAGIKVIPVVPSVALAKRMEREGADALIVEGCEAGGHIGELTTMVLVPQVSDAVSIPVIAAGGIADGRGMAAAMMLGADGVQIGTRFLVSYECSVHEKYKQKVLKANDIDTVVTGRSTGHPVRVLRNKLTRMLVQIEKEENSAEAFEALGKGALPRAARDGDVEMGSVMAGQSAGLVNKEQSCADIVTEICSEAESLLCSAASRLEA